MEKAIGRRPQVSVGTEKMAMAMAMAMEMERIEAEGIEMEIAMRWIATRWIATRWMAMRWIAMAIEVEMEVVAEIGLEMDRGGDDAGAGQKRDGHG